MFLCATVPFMRKVCKVRGDIYGMFLTLWFFNSYTFFLSCIVHICLKSLFGKTHLIKNLAEASPQWTAQLIPTLKYSFSKNVFYYGATGMPTPDPINYPLEITHSTSLYYHPRMCLVHFSEVLIKLIPL